MDRGVTSVSLSSGLDALLSSDHLGSSLAGLTKSGAFLWNAEQFAELRIQLGASHAACRRGSWVTQSFNYMTNEEGDILVASEAHNTLLRDQDHTSRAYHQGEEASISSTTVRALLERAESDPNAARKTGVFRLKRDKVWRRIPVTALDEYELTLFLFGEQAKLYGDLLQQNKIARVPLTIANTEYARRQQQPFARGLWVGSFMDRSSLGSLNHFPPYQRGCTGGVCYSPR